MMIDARLTGLVAIAFTSTGELPAANARAIIRDASDSASVFHIGAGGLLNFIASPDLATAWNGGGTIVAFLSDSDEAAELRSRVKRAARNGFSELSVRS